MCPIHTVPLCTLLTVVPLVSGFINDPLDPTTLRTTTTSTTTTTQPHVTQHPSQPSNPGQIPSAFKNQLDKMQDDLNELTKQNSALKLQVTSLENDVTTLIQLQERVRTLEEDNIKTKRQLATIQSSGSLTTRVQALETSQPEIKADISNLKLEFGTHSRAFNSVTQAIQKSLDSVTQTVNNLVAGGQVTPIHSGGQVHVPTHAPGTATTAKTTPLRTILHDCLDVYTQIPTPGVFTIQPPKSPKPFQAFCDHGWTIIQKRIDGRTSFSSPFRIWADFVGGFGNASREYWLGNENVYNILAQTDYGLRVEGVGYSGKLYWAQYSNFTIENERNYYRIHVSGYTGNFDDTMETANGNAFVTPDHAGDVRFFRDCSGYTAAGWWANTTTSVSNCGYNLNAMYMTTGSYCMSFAGICVKSSVMKIIPSSTIPVSL